MKNTALPYEGSPSSACSGVMVPLAEYRELEERNRNLAAYCRNLEIKLAAAVEGKSGEVEEEVIAAIRERRERGRRKYETTMDRDDLTTLQWAQHAQEEAMDLAIYLQRLKRDLQNSKLNQPQVGLNQKP